MLRVDDHSKLKPTEGFCINGNLVDITLVKSRTNRAGNSVTLVFNQETGFDQELSLFYMLKTAGKFNGAGAYLYLGDRDDIKFSQKTFKTKLAENDELKQLFMIEVTSTLKAMLEDQMIDIEKEEIDETNSVSSSILDMINIVAA